MVKSSVDRLLFKREVRGLCGGPFVRSFSSNPSIVARYELLDEIEEHNGCVNTISWNKTGSLLVSGSDDKRLCIYDHYKGGSLLQAIKTGHSANIFSAKFLPYHDDHIISCAGDSTIRTFKNFKLSNVFMCHNNRVKKLSTLSQDPFVFYSASEDATIRRFDLREQHVCSRTSSCNNIVYTLGSPEADIADEPVEVFSIAIDPATSHYMIAGGSDPYLRLFDLRATGNNNPVKSFCPRALTGRSNESHYIGHITGVAYSWNGQRALATRSGNAIEMYDLHAPSGELETESLLKFTGHCNIRTVKEVNFIGTRSEFVASGSDDGNIFLWDADPAAATSNPALPASGNGARTHGNLLNILSGDRSVVNCCASHPFDPIFASSGIENNVKIWAPSGIKQSRLFYQASEIMERNNQRHNSNTSRTQMLPTSVLQALLRAMEGADSGEEDEENDEESEEGEDDEEGDAGDVEGRPRRRPGRLPGGIQCAQQ